MVGQRAKRKYIMSLLYLSEFHSKAEMKEQTELFVQDYVENDEVKEGLAEILLDRFEKVYEKLGVIDPMIAGVAVGWKLDRMSKIDLSIMRLAVFEIFYDDEIPSAVAIAEAVALANSYGSDDASASFINGILGKLEKNRANYE